MISKEMIGASTIPIILSILIEGEDYGYEIIKKVKTYSGGQLEWSEPMLYPVLHRLDRGGYITATWKVLDNGRKRKYYAITAEGKSLLAEKKSEWQQMMLMLSNMWGLNLRPS